jgi:hypothetical protein
MPSEVYNPDIANDFASLVDFVSMHYFLPERCFETDLKALQSKIGNKPIILEEFGLHSLAVPKFTCGDPPPVPLDPPNLQCDQPHKETEQAAYYNALLSISESLGVAGTLFWNLTDFSYILDGSQQSHHCQGILRNAQVSVCENTNPDDYSEKPAAEIIRRHYAPYIAYLDLFNGWVDQKTDAPPAGWSDNWQDGRGLMRGYNLSKLFWSHDQGKIAFTKIVTGSTTITSQAISPELLNINIDNYPFLQGSVYSYTVRDIAKGSNAMLHIGIQEGSQLTRILTITPPISSTYDFTLDLSKPPTNWSGTHTFRIVLELEPVQKDGYAATYEFDWIGITGYRLIYLPVVRR